MAPPLREPDDLDDSATEPPRRRRRIATTASGTDGFLESLRKCAFRVGGEMLRSGKKLDKVKTEMVLRAIRQQLVKEHRRCSVKIEQLL